MPWFCCLTLNVTVFAGQRTLDPPLTDYDTGRNDNDQQGNEYEERQNGQRMLGRDGKHDSILQQYRERRGLEKRGDASDTAAGYCATCNNIALYE